MTVFSQMEGWIHSWDHTQTVRCLPLENEPASLTGLWGGKKVLQLYYGLAPAQMEKLMALYQEGNRENAEYFYPELSPEQGLLRAREDFCRYLREDFFRVPGGVYCIWEEAGVWISALRLEPWEDGLLLEALETHPDFRKQGYAKKLVQAMQRELTGKRIYSHVSKKNKASLAVHGACGFTVFRDSARMVDGTVTAGSFTLLWESNSR